MAELKARGTRLLFSAERRPIGALGDLLSVKFRRIDRFLLRGFEAALEGRDFRYGTTVSLALIAANPGISQNEITRVTGIDKSAIVAIVDKLEDLGWAVRQKSASDRRRYSLQATPEGQAELDRVVAAVAEAERILLAGIPAEEIERLNALLDRVNAACIAALERADD